MEQPPIQSGPAVLSAAEHELRLSLTERLAGQQGVSVSWPSNLFDGTLIPEVSLDGGTNWKAVQFAAPASGEVSLFYAGDAANDADSFLILTPGPATHVRVRVSAYTSGTITPTLRAAQTITGFLYGSDGSNLRAAAVVASTPDTCEYGVVVRIAGSGGSGTSATDDAAFTVGTTAFTPVGGTYKSTLDNVDDNDAGAFAMTQQRALYVSHLTPAGDSMVDDTNNALNVTAVTTVTVGGQSATDTTLATTVCPSQANIRFSTSNTRELIAMVCAKMHRICYLFVLADGDTDITFVSGTGTNCAANCKTLMGVIDLSSTNGRGFTAGSGAAVILDGCAVSHALCVASSQPVALTVFARYATY